MNLFKWGSSSLFGHIVVAELVYSLPLFIALSASNYSEGTLTISWAVWIAFVSATTGLIGAIVFWYAVTSQLIMCKRRKP